MMLTERKVDGSWWLPDRPDRKVPGFVVHEGRRIHLVLQDALQPYEPPPAVDGVVHHDMSVVTDPDIPIVLGDLQDGRPVTAINPSGSNPRGPFGRVTEVYRIDALLFGGHVVTDSFAEVRFELDYLPSWIDAPSLSGDDPRRLDGTAVDLLPVTLGSAEVGGATIRIVCSRSGTFSDDRIDLRRHIYFEVELTQPGSVLELLNYWGSAIQDLLCISLGQTVRFSEVAYQPPSDGRFRPRELVAWLPLILDMADIDTLQAIENVDNYTSPTLAKASSFAPLSASLPAWFSLWSANRSIVALLLGHYYAPFMFISHQYASIFQAVEGLHDTLALSGRDRTKPEHRARVKAIIDAATEAGVSSADLLWAKNVLQSRNDKTLANSIDDVVRAAGDAGRLIHEKDAEFGSNCATLRGLVSHPAKSDRSRLATAMYWYGSALSWVARIVLLQRLEIPDVSVVGARHYSLQEVADHLQGLELVAREQGIE